MLSLLREITLQLPQKIASFLRSIFKYLALLHGVIPRFWQYLLGRYTKTTALCLLGFLVILLSTRLEDAARLVTLGAGLGDISLYILYQIPYVLQVALPISSLIGALYLFQKMSAHNELTAARTSCMSLFSMIVVLVLFAFFMSLISFHYIFDMSVKSHLAAKKLEFTLRQTHPLAILQNSKMLENQGISLDMKGSLVTDKHARDMVMTVSQSDTDRLSLVIAKKLASTDQFLHANAISLITTQQTDPNHFDDLYIENAKESITTLQDLSVLTNKRKMWKASNDNLSMQLLLAKIESLEQKKKIKEYQNKPGRKIKKKIGMIYSEITRRISLSISIVTFTLLGIAFGSFIGRHSAKQRFIYVIVYTALFLVCYLAAKSIQDKALLGICLYLLPHVILNLASIKRLQNIEHGVEV